LNVVTTNFPLAQLVANVGGNRVTVTDLSKGAADDRAVDPSPAQVAELRHAALVVEVGDGYQSRVEAAAGAGPGVLALLPRLGGVRPGHSAEFWLDPTAMRAATGIVAGALRGADPAGAQAYANGDEDFTAVLSTLDIDFQNTLSDCPNKVVFTPDDALAGLATRYQLRLDVLAANATPGAVARAATLVRDRSLTTVFSEPPVTDPALAALAGDTHTKLLALDTMDGAAPPPEPSGYSYFNRMEGDLARLSTGLRCVSTNEP
jgi:zinc transport system substrate-binding protein